MAYPQHTNAQVLGLKLTGEAHLDVCKSEGTMQHLDFPLSLPHFQGSSDYLLPLATKVKRVEATRKLRKLLLSSMRSPQALYWLIEFFID